MNTEKTNKTLQPMCPKCESRDICLSLVGTNSMCKCIWWGYLIDHAQEMKEVSLIEALD